jgi:hypothetical protein
MSEWWTYRLSDFLLFAPRTYYRLFELYNADIWPAQLVALALGLAILVLLWRGPAARGRIIAAILAATWLFVAWAFHFQRYAIINWAAVYFAAGFALQALLLIWICVVRGRLDVGTADRVFVGDHARIRPVASVIRCLALCLFLFALLVQPAIGPLLGRSWTQAELFGVAPDPTALATLAVLLLAADRVPWTLMILPLLWCVVTGGTLWTMQAPDASVTPLAALLATSLLMCKAVIRSRGDSSRSRKLTP